jgi:glyoxylase-like metal-dependent hydrolase (beta-lactamase superfamily II)
MITILKEGNICRYEDSIIHASSTVTLIEEEDTLILVDTGNFSDAYRIQRSLSRFNLTPLEINVVINTHNHLDHTGNNHLFKNALLLTWENSNLSQDVLPKGIYILPTPGHTSDHISVVVCKRRTLIIAGDAIPTHNNLFKRIPPAISQNRSEAFESMKKIVQIADWIIPGHDGMVRNPFKK